jgi:hypothetical protein
VVKVSTRKSFGGIAVELANLILEYLKVLVWPLITVLLILLFRKQIADILRNFSARMSTAETLKLGIMGQEVELSGTAKELIKEQAELLSTPSDDISAQKRAEQIEKSIKQLSDPFADVVGVTLFNSKNTALALEEITYRVMAQIGIKGEIPPLTIISISNEIEKILNELIGLNLAKFRRQKYRLTDDGEIFFRRVMEKQAAILKRFKNL